MSTPPNLSVQTSTHEELVNALVHALSQRALFSREHPRVSGAAHEFAAAVAARLDADRKDAWFLGLVNGRLVHEGRLLLGSTLVGRKLVRQLEWLRCGGLLLKRGLAAEEVLGLLELCVRVREPLESLEVARKALDTVGEHVQLSPPYEDPAWFGQFLFERVESDGAEGSGTFRTYRSLFDSVETAHARAGGGGSVDPDAARGSAEGLISTLESDGFSDLLQVVRYPNYDTYTVGHSVRVAVLAVQVGRSLGFERELLVELGTAGLLHDIGKSNLPHEILFKPGALSDDERRVVARHPKVGAELLLAVPNAGELSIGAAFGHHLRHDGGGYPRVPPWFERSTTTSIVQACDVYEALTAVRPYKPALSARRAFEIMLDDRGAFDPAALGALIRSLGIYPPGTRVELVDGTRAEVLAAGTELTRPIVRTTHAADGRALAEAERRTLDLAAIEPADLSIARALIERPAPIAAHERHGCC
ncbi:MAG: HD domain-containing protein [Planctomycetes bacterium]|nr:HD domain-containing protein [Planctomycetota bacterium]